MLLLLVIEMFKPREILMIGHIFSGKIDLAGFITCIFINSEKLGRRICKQIDL